VNDRILASRTGVAAVEQLLAGTHDAMVGVVNGAIAVTPFEQAIGNQKPLQRDLLHVLKVLAS
jgi:6-phosphofructokinase 1